MVTILSTSTRVNVGGAAMLDDLHSSFQDCVLASILDRAGSMYAFTTNINGRVTAQLQIRGKVVAIGAGHGKSEAREMAGAAFLASLKRPTATKQTAGTSLEIPCSSLEITTMHALMDNTDTVSPNVKLPSVDAATTGVTAIERPDATTESALAVTPLWHLELEMIDECCHIEHIAEMTHDQATGHPLVVLPQAKDLSQTEVEVDPQAEIASSSHTEILWAHTAAAARRRPRSASISEILPRAAVAESTLRRTRSCIGMIPTVQYRHPSTIVQRTSDDVENREPLRLWL